MSFRKFSANQIFNGNKFIDDETVLITDEAGNVIDLVDLETAGDNVERLEGILSPGFVNCHCHLELGHLKGMFPEKTGLVEFVASVITQRNFDEEVIAAAIEQAETEMLNNGIVAVGDICNKSSTVFQKQKQNLLYHNFIEVAGWNPQLAASRFESSKELENQFRKISDRVSISPHAPYSVSNDLWKLMQPDFKDAIITIHNQETLAEEELFIAGEGSFLSFYEKLNIINLTFSATGKRSIYSALPYMRDAANLLLVHNTFMKEEDIDFATSLHNNITFCLCPNANLYIEDALPPVDLFINKNYKIVLGTDSLASNHQLNILSEIRTLLNAFPQLSLAQLLQWATLNGTKVLKMDDKLGSLEKGKQPGIVLINNDLSESKRIL